MKPDNKDFINSVNLNIHTADGSVDSVVSKRMHLFLQYINDRFAEKITLEGLAESAHVSEIASCTGFHGQSYFGKCFREKMNCTPREYRARK